MRLTAFALVACLPVTALADDMMGETGHPAGGISNPGQADYLYASANIAMQVGLK